MMTQAILKPPSMGGSPLKRSFNDLLCEAEVNTLMQMTEAVDIKNIESIKDTSNTSEDIPAEANSNGKIVKEKRHLSSRNLSGRPYDVHTRRRKDQARIRRRTALNPAPGNTTQFLMSDRACLDHYSDSDIEDDSCRGKDFEEREFSKDYDKLIPVKQKMPKSKLIEEYIMIEKDVKLLEKKYEEMSAHEQLKARLGTVDYDWEKGEVAMEPEIAEKIRIFQEEIEKLAQENRSLALENERLGAENSSSSEESSCSDSSDTDSSSSESESDSDEDTSEEENDVPQSSMAASKYSDNESKKDDTGYESDRSIGSKDSKTLVSVTSSNLRK